MKTLSDWEKLLAPQIDSVELVGEINITVQEKEQLGQQLGHLLKQLLNRETATISEAIRGIKESYPACFACFLVAQGVHGYGGSEGFWPGVEQVFKRQVNANWQRYLGELFEDILIAKKLSLFPDMKGQRFVSLILVHGGIPDYSLDDFFSHLLHPVVTKSAYRNLTTDELIEEWLFNNHHVQADKPVGRFLQFGGQVAEDFVKRCRELADDYLTYNRLATASEIGLPDRIVAAFEKWVENNSVTTTPNQTGFHLRKPQFRLDPGRGELFIDIPPQQFPITLTHASILWLIKADERTIETIPIQSYRVKDGLRTSEKSIPIEVFASYYEVSLVINEKPDHVWRYHGLDTERPLLIFDSASGKLLPRKPFIPQKQVWLLYAARSELTIQHPGRLIRDFLSIERKKGCYICQEWDLSQAQTLQLTHNDKNYEFPIRADESTLRPYLVEEPSPLFTQSIYMGQPPTVRIPLSGRGSLTHELRRWRFMIRSIGATLPQHDALGWQRLPDVEAALIKGVEYVDLPLTHPDLLGEAPMGRFEIRFRGPLGRDADLYFRIMPHLEISGHEEIYLPDANGISDISLLVETKSSLTLVPQTEDQSCQVEQPLIDEAGRQLYEIIVPSTAHTAKLIAVRAKENGSSVQIPLTISLSRLEWALQIDPNDDITWHNTLIKKSFDELITSFSPQILVRFGNSVTELTTSQLNLRMVDDTGQEYQTAVSTSHNHLHKFELNGFFDTIRHTNAPLVRFELNYPELKSPLPLLYLSQQIEVENVKLTLTSCGEVYQAYLTWQEAIKFRYRRVRFWPLWKIWQPYWEERIPDEADDELFFELSVNRFTKQAYLVEFLIVDPWIVPDEYPRRPKIGSTGTATIELGEPFERRQQIDRLSRTQPDFETLLEGACIERWINRQNKFEPFERSSGTLQISLFSNNINTYLYKCQKHLEHACVQQILFLVDFLRRSNEKIRLGEVRQEMFSLPYLKRLAQAYQSEQISQAEFEAYLSYLPTTPLLSPEVCERLLDLDHEPTQLETIRQLLEQAQLLGVEAVLRKREEKSLSKIDALNLLKIKLGLARDYLQHHFERLDAVRLWLELDDSPHVISLHRSLNRIFNPQERKQMYEIIQQLHRHDSVGVEQVLTRYKQGTLSEDQAVNLLKLNKKLSADYLKKRPTDSQAFFLLEHVSPDDMPLVKVGYWVYSVAGWGRIETIEELMTGQPQEYFMEDQPDIRLKLILRPAHDADEATLEIYSDRTIIQFVHSVKRYQCTKPDCCFITTKQNLLKNKHNRVAHDGLSPQYKVIKDTKQFRSVKPLRFHVEALQEPLL